MYIYVYFIDVATHIAAFGIVRDEIKYFSFL